MNKIKHIGVICEITGNCISVRILQSSACDACKMTHHCNAAETKEKVIKVFHPKATFFSEGEQVTITADASVGFRASWYGYILPLMLMILVLVLALYLTKNEGIAALSALGILIPYYAVLYLLRNRISHKLTFSIEK